MMSVSPPKSAAQAVVYAKAEFANAKENYYSQGQTIVGQWHGELAARWGLTGDVSELQFARLAHGRHPITDEQLVRHQTSRDTSAGKRTMEHRAGWDATFSAPKSVSLTALVGGDTAVRDAHRIAVDKALAVVEQHAQARLGGNRAPETTANLVAARFEHDSARPVRGYAAPQVHTHVFFFNMTQTAADTVRPLQPREIYKTKAYATAVYRSELAHQLQQRGYQVERGETDQPEILRYSADYLEASSPRRTQIEERLAELGLSGAKASEIAALGTREKKSNLTHAEVQAQHQTMAAQFGHQPAIIVANRQCAPHQTPGLTADAAVLYSRDRNLERDAVVDRRSLLRDALVRSMGSRTVDEVHQAFAKRTQDGTFVAVTPRLGSPSQHYTTPEMQNLEQENIARMQHGPTDGRPLAAADLRRDIEQHYPHLSEHQRDAVTRILGSSHQVQALDGVAGVGKTTVLSAVRDQAEREGWHVQGFAPTSRAAQLLVDAGIPSTTLQRHLVQPDTPDAKRRLYVLDESSLASTPQVHALLERLPKTDRILLVGDVRQHEAVDAGAPFRQLIDAGVYATRLEQIVRQQDPALKAVVEDLARGQIPHALAQLEAQGRIHELPDRRDRYQAIATEYLKQPQTTLVVSPDNQSRTELNQIIRRGLQDAGLVHRQEHAVLTLVPRNELTGPDRQWASRYEVADLVRYTKGSAHVGVKAGDYARVVQVHAGQNLLSVRRIGGAFGDIRNYDPARLHGVTVYREVERRFSVGDTIQFTAPDKALGVANGERGTIAAMDSSGIRLMMERGHRLHLPAAPHQHLDWAYCVTSHKGQGQTADYVLFHADTSDRVAVSLSDQRLAYVALSRGRIDAQVFTDSRERLPQVLGREVNQQTALGQEQTKARGFGR